MPAFAAPLIPPPIAPFAECPNQGYQLQTKPGGQSDLGYFDLNTSTFVKIKSIGADTNAFGYSKDQRVFWGMRTANPIRDTLVRIDSAGNTTEGGPLLDGVVPAPDALTTNTGTVADNKLYLHTKVPANELIVVDINPASPTFAQVQNRKVLDLASSALPFLEIGDWDFDPVTGKLISLAMDGHGPTGKRLLVSIDPGSGHVEVLQDLSAQLPDGSNYGHVYVEEGGSDTVYVANNDVDRRLARGKPGARSQTFGIRYGTSPMVVTPFSPGDPLLINDGADCLVATDFGDAPDSYYTLNAHQGPGHILTTVDTPRQMLAIGKSIDADLDGLPGPMVDGDDRSQPVNDEDGLKAGTTLALDGPSVKVPITNTTGAAAVLAGWLDLDLSGTFDADERAMAHLAPNATSAKLVWDDAAKSGETYLRLRLYPAADANVLRARVSDATAVNAARQAVLDPQPGGLAFVSGGEIEDHQVRIEEMLAESGNHSAPLVTWGLLFLAGGTGLVAMAGLTRRGAISWGRPGSANRAGAGR